MAFTVSYEHKGLPAQDECGDDDGHEFEQGGILKITTKASGNTSYFPPGVWYALTATRSHQPVWMIHDADLTDIALLMADFNLYAIPVVHEQDRVLGVVTVDDVLEATIPEDWRRREPAPRPVREITQPSDDRNVPGGETP